MKKSTSSVSNHSYIFQRLDEMCRVSSQPSRHISIPLFLNLHHMVQHSIQLSLEKGVAQQH
nr:hypothetical protein Iba_chr05bCG3690 [Ipomoea batatas]